MRPFQPFSLRGLSCEWSSFSALVYSSLLLKGLQNALEGSVWVKMVVDWLSMKTDLFLENRPGDRCMRVLALVTGALMLSCLRP